MLRQPSLGRVWRENGQEPRPPQPGKWRHIGRYALTTEVAPWVKNAMVSYHPSREVLELVEPFAAEFHALVTKEKESSSGLHDLDTLELVFQSTLEVGAAIILAASSTEDPVSLTDYLHTSRAGGDNHFVSWGRLITGLECDPPIIVQFPFYLLMCRSFTLDPIDGKEDYVYSALTAVDWVSALF